MTPMTTLLLCALLALGAGAAADTVRLGDCTLAVTPLASDDFSGDLANWVVEGNSQVEVRDGRLCIETPARGYATVWYRRPFTGDQLIRFRARLLPPKQASNINFFFCAGLPDGADFFAPHRTGAYAEYHQVINYTMTFTGEREGQANAPGYMRLRKNPGFHLVGENLDFKAEIETDYDVAIAKVGSLIRVFLNGQPSLRFDDVDEAGARQNVRGGYAGFRTFWSRLTCDDFAVWQIVGGG
ncbi:MAG: YesU family protein [Armatimonadetes bacterium]|nr:YesU family protein [Armatimonadota bacterium]